MPKMNRCRACGEIIEKSKDLRCKKCKEEIRKDFEWEWIKHSFDYYFRFYQQQRWKTIIKRSQ